MFGRFFDTTEVDQLADWVVAEVKRALPPRQTPGASGKAGRAEKLNQVLSSRVAEFSRNASLNVYKKAHLAARVREEMTAHGYPEAFVKAFSIDLLAQLRAAKSRKN